MEKSPMKCLMTCDGELRIPSSFNCILDFLNNPGSAVPIIISKDSYYNEDFYNHITGICKGNTIIGLVNENFEVILAFDEQSSIVFLINFDQTDQTQLKILDHIQTRLEEVLNKAYRCYSDFYTKRYTFH